MSDLDDDDDECVHDNRYCWADLLAVLICALGIVAVLAWMHWS